MMTPPKELGAKLLEEIRERSNCGGSPNIDFLKQAVSPHTHERKGITGYRTGDYMV